jgi:site-specific DNA recombinase
MTDRFSRSGVGGMGIAEQLREKYGVALFAIAQPTSVKDESGIFSQNIQFLVSNYENKMRRKRMIDGMTAKFAKGEWVTRVPQGYSVIKTNRERKIVVNETGKKLRKAFLWKADGMKNEEIIFGLRAMGVKMYKQQLTKIFKKPFYCGLVNHGLLDGKIVQGHHEPLITPEIFLKVNEIHQVTGNWCSP